MNSFYGQILKCRLHATLLLAVALVTSAFATQSWAQGPSPESAPTQFPGGAYLSYNSVFQSRHIVSGAFADPSSPTARPTFEHAGIFRFAWSPRTNWEVMTQIPVVTTNLNSASVNAGGTGLGDIALLLKYRFLRRDSPRGTTQISITAGPKLPTGRTDLRSASGELLPVPLQPGTGSADLYLEMDGTYTGLLNLKRLVADESVSYTVRTAGSQNFRLGSEFNSRFWLSYRPYQTKLVDKEWFIGPSLDYRHYARDELAGASQPDSGGYVLSPGVTTYFSPMPGIHLWFAFEMPIAQNRSGAPTSFSRQFSIGITKQFLLGRLGRK